MARKGMGRHRKPSLEKRVSSCVGHSLAKTCTLGFILTHMVCQEGWTCNTAWQNLRSRIWDDTHGVSKFAFSNYWWHTGCVNENPRAQVFAHAATVAAFAAKLASIPGIPELVPATVFLADGAPLNPIHQISLSIRIIYLDTKKLDHISI